MKTFLKFRYNLPVSASVGTTLLSVTCVNYMNRSELIIKKSTFYWFTIHPASSQKRQQCFLKSSWSLSLVGAAQFCSEGTNTCSLVKNNVKNLHTQRRQCFSFELASCCMVSVKHIPWQVAINPSTRIQILFLCSNLSEGYLLKRVKMLIHYTAFYCRHLRLDWNAAECNFKPSWECHLLWCYRKSTVKAHIFLLAFYYVFVKPNCSNLAGITVTPPGRFSSDLTKLLQNEKIQLLSEADQDKSLWTQFYI